VQRFTGTDGRPLKLRREYTIRVLVPCYKESLAIVQRTIFAARRADLPMGCRVIIYLCDDGDDRKKQAWVESLNDVNVIYVTGATPPLQPLLCTIYVWQPKIQEFVRVEGA
jgi:cellulose synthase/poly-beta-1,6-N-acetylglucosamine synthase-like glycosyltransferase